jgi:hypothetical protein
MPDDATVLTLRAAVETILPSREGRPGPAELGGAEHVAEALDALLPGLAAMAGMLFDAYAAEVRPGSGFAALPMAERDAVLRSMAREVGQEMQDLIGAVLLFTVSLVYNERTGYDRRTGRLVPPAVWSEVGFAGPSAGHPSYREPS